MKKVRGSSAAFQWGRFDDGLTITKYSNGCLRHALIKSTGIKEHVDEIHAERGLLNENRFAAALEASQHAYVREKSVDECIAGFSDVFFVGRLDFLVTDQNGSSVVELKSSESSSVLSEVIRKGHYKPENLAQLIAYMITERLTRGKLIYTHYKRDKTTRILKENLSRTFDVMIDDQGNILIDQVKSPFTVYDQLEHRQASAECIQNMQVGNRPYKWAEKFDSPCAWCPFKLTCDKYDAGEFSNTREFLQHAQTQAAFAAKKGS
jgi:hypothetical protein